MHPTEAIIDKAHKIQDKSKESTERSKTKVQEIIDMGTAINSQLKDDTDKLEKQLDTLDDIHDELGQAKKQLIGIARGIAKNKLMIGLIVLLLIGILIFIITYTTKHVNLASRNSTAT